MAKTFTKSGLEQGDVKRIFDDLKKAYFCETEIEGKDFFNTATEGDVKITLQQLPVTEDGINLNMGGVNTTFKKLNTGEVWGSKVDRDDPDINFAVASVSDTVNEMFMGHEEADDIDSFNFVNVDWAVKGYSGSLEAKKGSLWLPAENGEGWVILPKVKMYGGLNGTTDSNTAYFDVTVTPETNADGCNIYILAKKA